MEYSYLFRPLKVAGVTFKNRIFASPTSLAELGPGEHYSQENIAYYRLRAAGGAACVTVGDVIVDLDTGRSHPQQVGLNEADNIPYLIQMSEAIHAHGAAVSIEIDHGGILCEPQFIRGKNAIGPSAMNFPWGGHADAMSEEQIYEIAGKYAQAAKRAKECGFDMVTLHGGHGWLIHQFISEMTNHRTDEWGGSFESRMRFPLLVIEKIRNAVGKQFPIEFRMSGSERAKGGYDIETGIEIAKAIDGKVDLIHVSAGTMMDDYSFILMHPGIFQNHGENSGLAKKIKEHVKTPVIAVGAFSEPDKMEDFLKEDGADGIALGRALIADPFLPKKLMRAKDSEIIHCLRCTECQSGMISNRIMRCTVNPVIGHELEFFHPVPVNIHKKILIAGGGPGGMQAALTAYERGHEVVLSETKEKLGGALKYADNIGFKRNMFLYREDLIRKVTGLPIEIRLNTTVDESVVREVNPDVLIAAVGAQPFILSVPGAVGKQVVTGADIDATTKLGKKVIVIGGGLIGCETGLQLALKGHEVTIIEMRDELAPDAAYMHRINLVHQLELYTKTVTGCCCREITEQGVSASDKKGNDRYFEADTVVMAAGMTANAEAVEALRPLVPEFYVVGDCMRPRKVMNATADAYQAVVDLGLY